MRKNRVHKKSVSEGFAYAKDIAKNSPKPQVESQHQLVHSINEEPVTVLWYSTESLTEDQEIGLKMVYGNDVNIDIVYDVPCHINSIKARIKKADVIAVDYDLPRMNISKVFEPFLAVDESKGPYDCIYALSKNNSLNSDACWRRYKEDDADYSRMLVTYSEIKVWKDLSSDYITKKYISSAIFSPQEPLRPACILMPLPVPNSRGQYRIYRYMFIDSHEFEYYDVPWSLDEWLISDKEDMSDYVRAILEEVADTSNPLDYAVGYMYDDSITDFENGIYTGQLVPLHINDFPGYEDIGYNKGRR